MKVIALGVGSSAGTPVIGCDCATCMSPNPRNKRTALLGGDRNRQRGR